MTNPKTLKQLVADNVATLIDQRNNLVADGFDHEDVARSMLKTLKDEQDKEIIRMNGLRISDHANTERGAWAVARKIMIAKL